MANDNLINLFIWFQTIIYNSLLSVESSVGLRNLWVKDWHLLWWWNGSSLCWLFINLKDGLGWYWWRWVSVSEVTWGSIWSSSGGISVVVWDRLWLISSACGTGWSIEWSVSSSASNSFAVNSWWSIVSMALWKFSWVLFDGNWGPFLLNERVLLFVVEFFSLHSDVLAEILITIHSSGEKQFIGWSTGNSLDTSWNAWWGLEETSSWWVVISPGWSWPVWWSISEIDCLGGWEEESNKFHFECVNKYNQFNLLLQFLIRLYQLKWLCILSN